MALVAYLASPRKTDSKKRPLPPVRIATRTACTAKRVADMMCFASPDSHLIAWRPLPDKP